MRVDLWVAAALVEDQADDGHEDLGEAIAHAKPYDDDLPGGLMGWAH